MFCQGATVEEIRQAFPMPMGPPGVTVGYRVSLPSRCLHPYPLLFTHPAAIWAPLPSGGTEPRWPPVDNHNDVVCGLMLLLGQVSLENLVINQNETLPASINFNKRWPLGG